MVNRLLTILASLWLIMAVAGLLRTAFAWKEVNEIPHTVLANVPFQYETDNVAYALANGKGFSSPFRQETGPTAWSAPVYPLILAAIFKLFGVSTYASFLAAVSLNVGFSVLTCIPVYWAGRKIGGLPVAAGSAWLWAIFPNAVVMPFEWILETSLSALLGALILWATLEVAESRRSRDYVFYGLLWGFTLMTNPAMGSLLPFLLGWLVWQSNKREGAWTGRPLLALGVAAICCVPWTIRNAVVLHGFVPFRSVLGIELWLGNNDIYFQGRLIPINPIDNREERAKYIQMGELAYAEEKEHEALQFIRTHPAEEWRMLGRRFVATWTGTATPITDALRTRVLFVRMVLLANMLVAIGALIGLFVLWRRKPDLFFPVAVFPLIFPIILYITLPLLRYRHPIDPVILLLAAIAFTAPFNTYQVTNDPITSKVQEPKHR